LGASSAHTMAWMSNQTFLHIESGAHGGALGQNRLPPPTDAQLEAGNYKMGRFTLYGLPIAIESPRGTYRTGMDAKTGRRWTCRLAAHYGYINGIKGADGDNMDVFVGFFPQSEMAYVVNQNVGGRFDEHKILLAFPDEPSARLAYQQSYSRDWDGLESIVPLSISQLRWWLRNGDLSAPLRAEALPPDGLETMTRKIQWNNETGLPYDVSLDQVLYQIRRSDAGQGLMLDAVSEAEILEEADEVLTLDALVSPFARLKRRMDLLRRVLDRTGRAVKTEDVQITQPFRYRGVTNVVALFKLTDGQTVSIYFHNPDAKSTRIAPTDEVISWKWLLNKKDITIVVAPERGADLNLFDVARRVMRLAERNSALFARQNARRAERIQSVQSLKDEIAALETELASAQNELEVAQQAAEDRQAQQTQAAPAADEQARREAALEIRRKMDDELTYARQGTFSPEYLASNRDYELEQYFEAHPDELKKHEAAIEAAFPGEDEDDDLAAPDFDPTTPENYAKVMADSGLQMSWQDRLDAFFQERIVAVRNALRALGWKSRNPADARLYKGDMEAQPTFTHVGAGKNVAGWAMNGIADDLRKTPEGFAAEVHAEATAKAMETKRARAARQKTDISYRRSADGLFTSFFPNTPEGEKAWKELNATPGADGGKVLAAHAESTIEQLRAAGYTVAEETSTASAEDEDAMLKELGIDAETNVAKQKTDQALIDAYVRSFGAAAAALQIAVDAANDLLGKAGIGNEADARRELDMLYKASQAANGIIMQAAKDMESAGISKYDDRLAELGDTPGVKAWHAAGTSADATRGALLSAAEESIKADGAAALAALPADAPLADVAAAIFLKRGIKMAGGKSPQIVSAIEAKDAELAWSILKNLDNKASAEIFERATGIKLAKTQRDRSPQIDAWAGITPEQRAQQEAKEAADRKVAEREANVRGAWGALKQLSIRDSSAGTVVDGQQYLMNQFNDGYTEINVYKVGATQAYRLRKGDHLKSAKSRVFNGFLKAALAFGGLREALQLVGALQAEPARLWAQESQRDLDPASGAQVIEAWDTGKADALLVAAMAADPNKPAAPIARDFIANYLQGRIVKTKLGDCVFNATSRSELSLSANRKNSLKIRVVPRVPEILIEGDTDGVLAPVEGRGSKNVEQHKIDGFYKFTKTVDLRDVRVFAEVKVGRRKNDVIPMVYSLSEPGVLLDSAIKEGSIAGAFSRMPIIAHSTTGYKPADMGSNAPWDSVLFKRHAESFDSAKAQAVACDAEGTVSASSAILDASAPDVNDDDDGLNIRILAVWDKDGNELDPETLEPLKPKDAGPSDDPTGAQKIAAVDAAYRFDNATDEFKAWLYESLSQADYSPFAAAKAMDEAAKRNGAGVEWGFFGAATLDDANADNESLTMSGAALDDVGLAVSTLQQALDVVKTNEPINRTEGNTAQASLEADVVASIEEAIAILTEGDYGYVESEIGETFEAEEALLDSADADGYVGKIMKDGAVAGRIDIGGDGKAMVYVGASGDQRVSFISSVDGTRLTAVYSDDDAPRMVDWLFENLKEADVSTVELTGKELGDFPDTPEGLIGLREAARAHFEAKRGKWVKCPAMPKDANGNVREVEIRQRGIDEFIRYSAKPEKLKLAAKVEEIIETAFDSQPEPNFKPTKKRGVLGYYRLKNRVSIAGEPHEVTVLIEQDTSGYLHYDFMLPDTRAKTALDSAVFWSKLDPATEAGGSDQGDFTQKARAALDSVAPAAGVSPDHKSGTANSSDLATLDAAGQEEVGGMLINLFIEGEKPEIVPTQLAGDGDANSGSAADETAQDAQKQADRALFQSVINGTVADILAPELADALEAAYLRHQTDSEMASLFEQAVNAYQGAMLNATANLS